MLPASEKLHECRFDNLNDTKLLLNSVLLADDIRNSDLLLHEGSAAIVYGASEITAVCSLVCLQGRRRTVGFE